MTEPLQTYAAWESGLTAMGYTLAKTSEQGSCLFVCDGKPGYRVASFSPNEATAAWMSRNGVIDGRCELNPNHIGYVLTPSFDLPEFGLEMNDSYHDDLTHVSKSMLSVFADSPVKYRAQYILGTMPRKKPTKPMKIGLVLHSLLLDKKTLQETAIEYPYSCYTNGEKPRLSTKRAEAFEAKVAPLICVRESEMATIRAMFSKAMASPFGELLMIHSDKAKFETRVDGELCGLKVKCRPDLFVELPDQLVVPDLKFTALFGQDEFEKTAKRFSYALQQSHYTAILEQKYSKPVSWSFWCGETVPPNRFGVRKYDPRSIEIADEYHRELLTRLKECYDADVWNDTFDTTMTIAPWDFGGEYTSETDDEETTIGIGEML